MAHVHRRRGGVFLKQGSVIPGFALAGGTALLYFSLLVLLPIGVLIFRATELGFAGIVALASEPRVAAALRTSFSLALAAGAFNAVFGTILAWVLVRYEFPGRRIVDAAIDLPFALPTAVAGISLATLYAPQGWLGALLTPFGWPIAFTRIGIFIALVFVGLPFVVRTVQPVLLALQRDVEEAAATLGAHRLTILRRIVLPPLLPAILTGFALASARGIGEYGSVIFIAGNLPFVSEIAPLLIVIKLEEYDVNSAIAIAFIMLSLSLAFLLAINGFQAHLRRRLGHVGG
jgi:sulfate transport system permease protein